MELVSAVYSTSAVDMAVRAYLCNEHATVVLLYIKASPDMRFPLGGLLEKLV